MNAERIFIDANILVYAHDQSEPEKRERAASIIRECWSSLLPPSISVQVLQETHVNLVRKGLAVEESAETVSDFLAWNVIENRVELFKKALVLQGEFQLSFWDASILAAALASGAEELWSEDFQEGCRYHHILAVNPFAGIHRIG